MGWLIPILCVLIAIAIAVGLGRINELFALRVTDGRVRIARGRVPPKLLRDLRDVMASSNANGTIRVVIESNAARVLTSGGLSEGQTQRLRNVVGQWPIAKIRAGAKR